MTDENRKRNILSEVHKAEQALAAGRALVAAGLGNDAISRAYYAAYHFACALLLTQGIEPKRHAAVPRLLAKHLEARLPPGAVSELARVQTFRNAADYDRETQFEPAEAAAELTKVDGFAAAARELLERDGWLPRSR